MSRLDFHHTLLFSCFSFNYCHVFARVLPTLCYSCKCTSTCILWDQFLRRCMLISSDPSICGWGQYLCLYVKDETTDTMPGIPFQPGIFRQWADCGNTSPDANYSFATLLLQNPEQKLWWSQSFNFSFLDVWQGLISILSMWSHPMFLMVELFDLCCWSMAGPAPSMSSTRSSLCSRSQPSTAWMRVMWCLRSSAPPSQDMASQRPLTRKVSNEKALLELQCLQ